MNLEQTRIYDQMLNKNDSPTKCDEKMKANMEKMAGNKLLLMPSQKRLAQLENLLN